MFKCWMSCPISGVQDHTYLKTKKTNITNRIHVLLAWIRKYNLQLTHQFQKEKIQIKLCKTNQSCHTGLYRNLRRTNNLFTIRCWCWLNSKYNCINVLKIPVPFSRTQNPLIVFILKKIVPKLKLISLKLGTCVSLWDSNVFN